MTIVIAEAGVNHNGNLSTAKKLIEVAAKSGADFVKFQSFNANKLVTKFANKADYQKISDGNSNSQLDMLKKLELTFEDQFLLFQHCISMGIGFLSTPFDLESAIFLNQLGVEYLKIPSGEITNLPLLELIGGFNKKIILSTGMSTLEEIRDALKVLISRGSNKAQITVLHCTSAYPVPFRDVNLRAMTKLADELNIQVGYSDHTPGTEVSLAAVALGATIIEKHFTLDHNMPGPDHKSSLTPNELSFLIKSIRNLEDSLGISTKTIQESELQNRILMRKSLVAKRPIRKGELLTFENMTCKRPATGISPMRIYELIGTVSKRDYNSDDLIEI